MSVKVNQDLLEERKKCGFNVEELTNYLDGSVQATENRRKLGKSMFICLYRLCRSSVTSCT